MAENKEQKTFIVKNKRSSLFTDKDGTVKNAADEDVKVTPGSKPKLIPDNVGEDKFDFGEIAINFVEGLETIQIKNSEGNIATFQNEVLVIDSTNKDKYFDNDGNLLKATTAKLVLDLTDETDGEGGSSGIDSEYVNFITKVAIPTIETNTLTINTEAHLNIFGLIPETVGEEYNIVMGGNLIPGYEIIAVIKNTGSKSCKIKMENGLEFDLEDGNNAQVAFISGGKEIYGRIL